MILSAGSPFRNPPKILDNEQVVTFNAIRYVLDTIDITYERLSKNLFEFSHSTNNERPSFPLLYSDAWTVVQNISIFCKIVENQFKIHRDDPLMIMLRECIEVRNSMQHIDARIAEVLFNNNHPIYGTLSWYSKENTNIKDGIITTLYSGTATNKKAIGSRMSNPLSSTSNELVRQIELTVIVKPNRNKELYEPKTIVIDDMISDLITKIKEFEIQIGKQIDKIHMNDRHLSDVYIQVLVSENQ